MYIVFSRTRNEKQIEKCAKTRYKTVVRFDFRARNTFFIVNIR